MFLRTKTKVMYWALLLTDFFAECFLLAPNCVCPN